MPAAKNPTKALMKCGSPYPESQPQRYRKLPTTSLARMLTRIADRNSSADGITEQGDGIQTLLIEKLSKNFRVPGRTDSSSWLKPERRCGINGSESSRNFAVKSWPVQRFDEPTDPISAK